MQGVEVEEEETEKEDDSSLWIKVSQKEREKPCLGRVLNVGMIMLVPGYDISFSISQYCVRQVSRDTGRAFETKACFHNVHHFDHPFVQTPEVLNCVTVLAISIDVKGPERQFEVT